MSTADIGATLYVATAAPATNDSTGFEALSWTQVNGFQSIGELGLSAGNIAIPDLQTGITDGAKGMQEGRDVPITLRHVASDTGQGNLKTQAQDIAGTVSVKIGYGTGTGQALQTGDDVIYATGYAHSWTPREKSDTSHRGYTVQFRQTNHEVEATEPA